jgi:hypothetical protein
VKGRKPLRRRDLGFVAAVALVLGAGPTVGDIGSCSDTATLLDIKTFEAERKELDCDRCRQCGFMTDYCAQACNPTLPSGVVIPSTCFPLTHDGQVCLDALEAASCAAYASFVADVDPTTPTECEFCLLVPDGGVE